MNEDMRAAVKDIVVAEGDRHFVRQDYCRQQEENAVAWRKSLCRKVNWILRGMLLLIALLVDDKFGFIKEVLK